MKANNKVEPVKWLSRYDGLIRRSGVPSRIDFNYQTPLETAPKSVGFGGNSPSSVHNLNRLANEVFRANTSSSFRIEVALFAAITLVSAWPIAMMISAIAHLLK